MPCECLIGRACDDGLLTQKVPPEIVESLYYLWFHSVTVPTKNEFLSSADSRVFRFACSVQTWPVGRSLFAGVRKSTCGAGMAGIMPSAVL